MSRPGLNGLRASDAPLTLAALRSASLPLYPLLSASLAASIADSARASCAPADDDSDDGPLTELLPPGRRALAAPAPAPRRGRLSRLLAAPLWPLPKDASPVRSPDASSASDNTADDDSEDASSGADHRRRRRRRRVAVAFAAATRGRPCPAYWLTQDERARRLDFLQRLKRRIDAEITVLMAGDCELPQSGGAKHAQSNNIDNENDDSDGHSSSDDSHAASGSGSGSGSDDADAEAGSTAVVTTKAGAETARWDAELVRLFGPLPPTRLPLTTASQHQNADTVRHTDDSSSTSNGNNNSAADEGACADGYAKSSDDVSNSADSGRVRKAAARAARASARASARARARACTSALQRRVFGTCAYMGVPNATDKGVYLDQHVYLPSEAIAQVFASGASASAARGSESNISISSNSNSSTSVSATSCAVSASAAPLVALAPLPVPSSLAALAHTDQARGPNTASASSLSSSARAASVAALPFVPLPLPPSSATAALLCAVATPSALAPGRNCALARPAAAAFARSFNSWALATLAAKTRNATGPSACSTHATAPVSVPVPVPAACVAAGADAGAMDALLGVLATAGAALSETANIIHTASSPTAAAASHSTSADSITYAHAIVACATDCASASAGAGAGAIAPPAAVPTALVPVEAAAAALAEAHFARSLLAHARRRFAHGSAAGGSAVSGTAASGFAAGGAAPAPWQEQWRAWTRELLEEVWPGASVACSQSPAAAAAAAGSCGGGFSADAGAALWAVMARAVTAPPPLQYGTEYLGTSTAASSSDSDDSDVSGSSSNESEAAESDRSGSGSESRSRFKSKRRSKRLVSGHSSDSSSSYSGDDDDEDEDEDDEDAYDSANEDDDANEDADDEDHIEDEDDDEDEGSTGANDSEEGHLSSSQSPSRPGSPALSSSADSIERRLDDLSFLDQALFGDRDRGGADQHLSDCERGCAETHRSRSQRRRRKAAACSANPGSGSKQRKRAGSSGDDDASEHNSTATVGAGERSDDRTDSGSDGGISSGRDRDRDTGSDASSAVGVDDVTLTVSRGRRCRGRHSSKRSDSLSRDQDEDEDDGRSDEDDDDDDDDEEDADAEGDVDDEDHERFASLLAGVNSSGAEADTETESVGSLAPSSAASSVAEPEPEPNSGHQSEPEQGLEPQPEYDAEIDTDAQTKAGICVTVDAAADGNRGGAHDSAAAARPAPAPAGVGFGSPLPPRVAVSEADSGNDAPLSPLFRFPHARRTGLATAAGRNSGASAASSGSGFGSDRRVSTESLSAFSDVFSPRPVTAAAPLTPNYAGGNSDSRLGVTASGGSGAGANGSVFSSPYLPLAGLTHSRSQPTPIPAQGLNTSNTISNSSSSRDTRSGVLQTPHSTAIALSSPVGGRAGATDVAPGVFVPTVRPLSRSRLAPSTLALLTVFASATPTKLADADYDFTALADAFSRYNPLTPSVNKPDSRGKGRGSGGGVAAAASGLVSAGSGFSLASLFSGNSNSNSSNSSSNISNNAKSKRIVFPSATSSAAGSSGSRSASATAVAAANDREQQGAQAQEWHVPLDAALTASAVLRNGPIETLATLTLPVTGGRFGFAPATTAAAAAAEADAASSPAAAAEQRQQAPPQLMSAGSLTRSPIVPSWTAATATATATGAHALPLAGTRRSAASLQRVGGFLLDDRADPPDAPATTHHGIKRFPERFPYESNVLALSRHYELLRRVATNHDTVVYEARCRATGQRLAVKVKDDAAGDAADKEVKLMTAVQGHRLFPQFVGWHAFPETGTCAIAMDFFDFDAVERLFDAPRDIRCYSFALLTALAALHERNIIYRDIKPANVLWNPETRRTKLIDFDVSTFATDLRGHRKHVGTDGYMAPEVLLVKHCRVNKVRMTQTRSLSFVLLFLFLIVASNTS